MRQQRHRSLRAIWSATAAVVLVLAAVSPAYAGKPDRTVLGPSDPSVSLAGEGCAFPVLWQPSADARRMITEFDDGRTVYITTNANPTLTNLDNDKTFKHRARYHIVETYDASTDEVHDVINGQIILAFWEGDQGPDGEVAWPGRLLRFTGRMELTVDADTFAYKTFAYQGFYTDVCAALA